FDDVGDEAEAARVREARAAELVNDPAHAVFLSPVGAAAVPRPPLGSAPCGAYGRCRFCSPRRTRPRAAVASIAERRSEASDARRGADHARVISSFRNAAIVAA